MFRLGQLTDLTIQANEAQISYIHANDSLHDVALEGLSFGPMLRGSRLASR